MATKRLISNEIIKTVQRDLNAGQGTLTPYNMEGYHMYYIGSIKLTGSGKDVIMHLDESVSKAYLALWNEDVGRILQRDLHKKYFEYFVYVGPSYKVLLRRMKDEESEDFHQRGFDNIIYGDSTYTLIKVVPAGESFSYRDRFNDYGVEKNVVDDIEYTTEDEPKQEENEVESYSLF